LTLTRHFLLSAIVLLCALTPGAQTFSFKHYQVENGLSNNAVICSVQDKRGFLWFGTKDGLNRFDGYTFKIFRHRADEALSIGSNFIYTLYEDENGTLWIGTEKGLYQYDEVIEGFHPVKAASAFQISELTTDKAGNLWFVAGLTLYHYNKKTEALTTYNPQSYFEATGICRTPDGVLWVATSDGYLQQYNAEKNSFRAFDLFGKTKPGASRWIEKIQPAGGDRILVGTGTAGLKIFSTHSFATQNVALQNGTQTDLFVRSFLQTAPEEFWVGTEGGIFVYNSSTGMSVNLQKKYNDPFSLSDNAIYTFCRDREGGVWAGTYFGGINYYPQQYTPFKKAFPRPGENSLSGNVVREIRKDDRGNLWIGTEDAGLNKLDPSGRFVQFAPSGNSGSLSYSNIHGLLLTGNELWIGTFEHGLDVLNIHTGKVVRHYSTATGKTLRSNFVYTIYQTNAGEIYIGTTIGLYRYNQLVHLDPRGRSRHALDNNPWFRNQLPRYQNRKERQPAPQSRRQAEPEQQPRERCVQRQRQKPLVCHGRRVVQMEPGHQKFYTLRHGGRLPEQFYHEPAGRRKKAVVDQHHERPGVFSPGKRKAAGVHHVQWLAERPVQF
jgi:ligand-binding sensor domain-containing protein